MVALKVPGLSQGSWDIDTVMKLMSIDSVLMLQLEQNMAKGV